MAISRQRSQVRYLGRLGARSSAARAAMLGPRPRRPGHRRDLGVRDGGSEDLFNSGKLVELSPDLPVTVSALPVHLLRYVPPVKVRAFLDSVVRSVADA